MNAVFRRSQLETSDIRTFFFKTDKPLDHTAGQFSEWTIEHDNPDSRGRHRWFTISSSPSEELISFTTRFDPKGSSFKKALLKLQPGDVIKVSHAMGDFVLPKLIQTPLIFVAGGIGVENSSARRKRSLGSFVKAKRRVHLPNSVPLR